MPFCIGIFWSYKVQNIKDYDGNNPRNYSKYPFWEPEHFNFPFNVSATVCTLFRNHKRSISVKVSKHQLLKVARERMEHKPARAFFLFLSFMGMSAILSLLKETLNSSWSYFEHFTRIVECSIAMNSCFENILMVISVSMDIYDLKSNWNPADLNRK